jgi:hypothetical protein
MPDWSSLSVWITPDRAISALGGAIIAGAVALVIDQRRRVDEGKNRFSEEKLRAYEHFISVLDVNGSLLLLIAEFAPLFKKIDRGESLGPWDVHRQGLLNERLEQIMQRYVNHDEEDTIRKLSLLSSGASTRASTRLMNVILKMKAHVDTGNYEKVGKLALRYELATASYLLAAREDLGLRN